LESNITDAALARYVRQRHMGQYVQWTFAAAQPRHPALKRVLDDIYASPITKEVLNYTGPIAFTRSIVALAGGDVHVLPKCAFAATGFPTTVCAPESVYVHHGYEGSWVTELRR